MGCAYLPSRPASIDEFMSLRLISWIISISTIILGTGAVCGQDYPNKPIRIITSESGGSNDLAARVIATGISKPLGQSVLVENRGGSVSAEFVSKGAADGYTVLVTGAPLWITPLLQKTSYDPVRDFSPITMLNSSPLLL